MEEKGEEKEEKERNGIHKVEKTVPFGTEVIWEGKILQEERVVC